MKNNFRRIILSTVVAVSAGASLLAQAQTASCPAGPPAASKARVYKNGILVPYTVSECDFDELNDAIAAVPASTAANFNPSDTWKIELGSGSLMNNVRTVRTGAAPRCALKDNGQPDQVLQNIVTYLPTGQQYCLNTDEAPSLSSLIDTLSLKSGYASRAPLCALVATPAVTKPTGLEYCSGVSPTAEANLNVSADIKFALVSPAPASMSQQCALVAKTNGLTIITPTTTVTKGVSKTTNVITYKNIGPSFCRFSLAPTAAAPNDLVAVGLNASASARVQCQLAETAGGDIVTPAKDPSHCLDADGVTSEFVNNYSLKADHATAHPQCTTSITGNPAGLKVVTPTLVTNTAARAPRYCAAGDIITTTRYGAAFDVNGKQNLTIESAQGNALTEGQVARSAKDVYEAAYVTGHEYYQTITCNSLVNPAALNSAIQPKTCNITDPNTGLPAYILSVSVKTMNAPYARCVYTNPNPLNGIGGYFDYELGGASVNVDRGCSAVFTVGYLSPAPPENAFIAPANLLTAVTPGFFIRNGNNIAVQNVRVDGQIYLGYYIAPTTTATQFVRQLICGSWDGTEKYCWMGGPIDTFQFNQTQVIANHEYLSASGAVLENATCSPDTNYPTRPTDGSGYYASTGNRLVVGNGCIGSFDLDWIRQANDGQNQGNNNLVLFGNYIDGSRLEGQTWDQIGDQSLFWVGSPSINWAGDRRITSIDGVSIQQGNTNIVLMENSITRSMEGVRFLERAGFDNGVTGDVTQNNGDIASSGTGGVVADWEGDKTLLLLGNTITNSDDDGLLFYGGGQVVLAPATSDANGNDAILNIPTLMTGNKKYAVRVIAENQGPAGELVTTLNIIQQLISSTAKNGTCVSNTADSTAAGSCGILGLGALLNSQALIYDHPPRFNMSDIADWQVAGQQLHLAAIHHEAATTNSEEKLTCLHPVAQDEDELVTDDLAANTAVAQLPGVTPNVTSLVQYYWYQYTPGAIANNANGMNIPSGFTEIEGQHGQDLDISQISPIERAGTQYVCQVVLQDGIVRVDFFDSVSGAGILQNQIAGYVGPGTPVTAESVAFKFDSDGDGVPDDMDCAPNDPTKWQMLAYGAVDLDGDGYWANSTINADGSLPTICSGATLPAGYRTFPVGQDPIKGPNEIADCDDTNPDLWQTLPYLGIKDANGIWTAATGTVCSGGVDHTLAAQLPGNYSPTTPPTCTLANGQTAQSGASASFTMYSASFALNCQNPATSETQTALCNDGQATYGASTDFTNVSCLSDTSPPTIVQASVISILTQDGAGNIVSTPSNPGTSFHVGDLIACGAASATDVYQGDSIVTSESLVVTSQNGTVTSTQNSSYAVQDSDIGSTFSCSTLATDSLGLTTTAAPTVAVTAVARPPVILSVSLSGDNHTGSILACTATAADADGSAFTILYAFPGTIASAYSANASYSITSADRGNAISCSAEAVAGSLTSVPMTSNSITPVSSAPVITAGSVSISSSGGSATHTGDTLTCVATAADIDGTTPVISYLFSGVQGSQAASASSGKYLVTKADRNHAISCSATANVGNLTSSTVPAATSITPVNSPPVVTSVALLGGNTTGAIITCSAASTDVDSDPRTYAFTWTHITGVPASVVQTSEAASQTYAIKPNDRGNAIGCSVIANDGFANSATVEATTNIMPVNSAPQIASVVLTSDAPAGAAVTTGAKLTCSASATDLDSDPTTIAYTFNNTSIASNSSSYLVQTGDRGNSITCTAVAKDAPATTSVAALSSPPMTSNVITPQATAPSVMDVMITGNSVTNSVLGCTYTASDIDGAATLKAPIVSFITMINNATAKTLATSPSYTVTAADRGTVIACQVSDTDDFGLVTTADSSNTITIKPSAPTISITSFTNTGLTTGSVLTCAAEAHDIDGDNTLGQLAYAYNNETAATLGQGTTYTLQAADRGHQISCLATITEDMGLSSSSGSPSVTPVSSAPVVTSVTLAGGNQPDTRLDCSATVTDIDGDLTATAFVFSGVSGTVDGSGSYLIVPGDIGNTIGCSATATAAAAIGGPQTSASIAAPSTITVVGRSCIVANGLSISSGSQSTQLRYPAPLALSCTQTAETQTATCYDSTLSPYSGSDTLVSCRDDQAPQVTQPATISPAGPVVVGTALFCAGASATDPDSDLGDMANLSYAVLSGSGNIMSSGSGPNAIYTIAETDVGQTFTCVTTATDHFGLTAQASSTVTATGKDRPPMISSVVLEVKDPFATDPTQAFIVPSQQAIITSAFASTDVKCVAMANDPDGAAPSLAYSFTVNGQPADANGDTLSLPASFVATASGIVAGAQLGTISCSVIATDQWGTATSMDSASQVLDPSAVCNDGTILAGVVPNSGADGQPIACNLTTLPWQGDTAMLKILNQLIVLVAAVAPDATAPTSSIALQSQFEAAINQVLGQIYGPQTAGLDLKFRQSPISHEASLLQAIDLMTGAQEADAQTSSRTRVAPGVIGNTSMLSSVLSVGKTTSSSTIATTTQSTILSSIASTSGGASSGSGGTSSTSASSTCQSGQVTSVPTNSASLSAIAQFDALLGQLSSAGAQSQLACSYTQTSSTVAQSAAANLTKTLVANTVPTSSQLQVASTLSNSTATATDQTALINELLLSITNLEAALQTALATAATSGGTQTVQQALQTAIQASTVLSSQISLNTTDVNQTTCYADMDGDGYTGTAALINLSAQKGTANQDCATQTYTRPGSATPVAYSHSNDGDCNDSDPTVWQNLSYQAVDLDGDGYFVGANGTKCSGASLPAGYRATPIQPGEVVDCNDSDASIQVNLVGYKDLDGDGHGAGPAVTVCASHSATLASVGLSADDSDCSDSNASVWQMLPYRWINTAGIWSNTPGTVCSGDSLAANYSATPPATPPTISSVSISINGSPAIAGVSRLIAGMQVACIATATDVYGDSTPSANLTPAYQVLVTTAHGASVTRVLNAGSPSYTLTNADKGSSVSCQADVTDAQGHSSGEITSALSFAVQDQPPNAFSSNPALIVASGSGKVGDSLNCSGGTTDPDDPTLNYTITWISSAQTPPVKVVTQTTGGMASDALSITPAMAHSNISCSITASDGTYSVSASSTLLAVLNSAPLAAALQMSLNPSGTPVTTTLSSGSASASVSDFASPSAPHVNEYTITVSATDADGDPMTFSAGAVASVQGVTYAVAQTATGSTSATYKLSLPGTLQSNDTASITFTIADGHSGSTSLALSLAVTHVQPAPPAVAGFLTSSGSGVVGTDAHSSQTLLLAGYVPPAGTASVAYAVVSASSPCPTSPSAYQAAAPNGADSGFGADGSYKVCIRETDALGNVGTVVSASFQYNQSVTGVVGNLVCQTPYTMTQGSQTFSVACQVSGYSDPNAAKAALAAATAFHGCAANLSTQSTDGFNWTVTGSLVDEAVGCNLVITLSDGQGYVAATSADLVRAYADPASPTAFVSGPTFAALGVPYTNQGQTDYYTRADAANQTQLLGWAAPLTPQLQREGDQMTLGFLFYGVSQ